VLIEALRHRVGLPARRQRLRTRGRKHGGGLFDDAIADELKTTKRLSWQACRAAAVLLTRRAGSYLMRQDQVQRACRTTHLFGPPAQLDLWKLLAGRVLKCALGRGGGAAMPLEVLRVRLGAAPAIGVRAKHSAMETVKGIASHRSLHACDVLRLKSPLQFPPPTIPRLLGRKCLSA
jgi:hypothetical protein